MKLIVVAGAVAILGGGMWLKNPFGAPNVYPLSPDIVYQRLMAVREKPSVSQDHGPSTVTASGEPGRKVDWAFSSGSDCTVFIAPEGAGKSRLDVSCGGGSASDGAAASMVTGYRRNEVIELVDATLNGRPYDIHGAKGATAARWPADRVHHDSFVEASGAAIKMDAEMRQQQAMGR